MSDRSGEILGGSYRLVRRIGEGGMGAVYEAEHLRLPRRFAIKLLHPHAAMDAEMVQRFRREAEIASDVGNEHIVEVVDFNVTEDGAPYIVMELLRGESLAGRLAREGALPLDEVATILDQLASAVHAAHQKGVVHRDLKPQNVHLERRADGRLHVKVLDFGISKVLRSTSVVTGAGAVFGTPQYMAPEQALGRVDEVGARTDVFAIGAMLYEMLAGAPPFAGDSLPAVLYAVVHGTPPPLAPAAPTVPAAACAAVERALAKTPADRHASAAELREAFLRGAGRDAAALPSFPETRVVSAADVPGAPTAQHDPRRSRRGLVLAASLVAAAGGAIGVSVAVGGDVGAPPQARVAVTSAPAPAVVPTAAPATVVPATTSAPDAGATARPRAGETKRAKRPARPLWEKDL